MFPFGSKKKIFGLVQRQVSLVFTAGQEYARVGLGQGPSLLLTGTIPYSLLKLYSQFCEVFLFKILDFKLMLFFYFIT